MIEIPFEPAPSMKDFVFHPRRTLVELGQKKQMVFHPPPSYIENYKPRTPP
jgi:hypothetical protein